jgi:hypothetical protein
VTGPATPVPVQALFEGDFLTFLVLLSSDDTVPQACEKVADGVVGRRIPARPGVPYVLRDENGVVVPDDLTIGETSIGPTDLVVVGFRS